MERAVYFGALTSMWQTKIEVIQIGGRFKIQVIEKEPNLCSGFRSRRRRTLAVVAESGNLTLAQRN